VIVRSPGIDEVRLTLRRSRIFQLALQNILILKRLAPQVGLVPFLDFITYGKNVCY